MPAHRATSALGRCRSARLPPPRDVAPKSAALHLEAAGGLPPPPGRRWDVESATSDLSCRRATSASKPATDVTIIKIAKHFDFAHLDSTQSGFIENHTFQIINSRRSRNKLGHWPAQSVRAKLFSVHLAKISRRCKNITSDNLYRLQTL